MGCEYMRMHLPENAQDRESSIPLIQAESTKLRG